MKLDFGTTSEIPLPKDPLDMIIGQTEAVRIARIAGSQKRHLLLVGPPGVGKSMVAKALAYHLPKPSEEVLVVHNPRSPERPFVAIRGSDEIKSQKTLEDRAKGDIVKPEEVPTVVADRMGFRCQRCGKLSSNEEETCPYCNKFKLTDEARGTPFSDLISQVFSVSFYDYPEEEVHLAKVDEDGNEEIMIFQSLGADKIRVIDAEAFECISKLEREKKSKVIIPLKRSTFVQATGASETELLGDVRHDPWGGVANAGGLQPYERVIPGAIHEAHEGVLFIDELQQLQHLQHQILTAMQDKFYPISGMNPTSSGAAVKVDKVPCDFIFVGACNINEVENILPPLRSRIIGSGYEVLLETTMPLTDDNVRRVAQFFAQEVILDGKIPHGTKDAVLELVKESQKRAEEIDGAKKALTLRLRDLGGVIRLAGDYAKMSGSNLIDKRHIQKAVKGARSVEQQLVDKYGSIWKGKSKDIASHHLISGEKRATGYA